MLFLLFPKGDNRDTADATLYFHRDYIASTLLVGCCFPCKKD